MNDNIRQTEDANEDMVKAAWKTAFQPTHSGVEDEAFAKRCEAVAEVGDSLRLLRAECARRGFMPLPLDIYIAEACAAAGASLHLLWQHATSQARQGWIALAKLAALPTDQARVMLRAWFASQDTIVRARGSESTEPLSILPSLSQSTPFDTMIAVLAEWEANYPPERKQRLERLLAQIEA